MATKELLSFPNLTSFGGQDKVLAYSTSLGNFGYIPAALLTRKGYACRRWDETQATPHGEAYGNIDYLRDLPYLLGLGCYLVTDNRERRKLSATNHNNFADGSPAALDGTMGQYMWCWNKFYYATWQEGNYTYEAVSLDPIEGKKNICIPEGGISALNAGVIDRDTNTLCSLVSGAAKYRGGAGVALTGTLAGANDKQTTMLYMPASNYSLDNARSYARKRGEGWEANWFVARNVTEVLFRIIYGNRNSQEAVNPNKDSNGLFQGGLGVGVTNMPDWTAYNGTYPIIPTNAGLEYGDACGSFVYNVPKNDGSTYYAAPVPIFFGLKNPFGHLWTRVSGLIINVGSSVTEGYVAPSLYNGYNTGSLSGMLKATELPRESGYIKRLSMNRFCGLPTMVGGSSSTYFCDQFYTNIESQGLRIRDAGGYSDNGSTAGSHYSRSIITASYAHSNSSVPLCYFREDPLID